MQGAHHIKNVSYALIFALVAFMLDPQNSFAGPTHNLQAVCDGTKPRDATNNCPECAPQFDAVKKEAQAIRDWVRKRADGLKKPLICGDTERARAKSRLTALAKEISDTTTKLAELKKYLEYLRENDRIAYWESFHSGYETGVQVDPELASERTEIEINPKVRPDGSYTQAEGPFYIDYKGNLYDANDRRVNEYGEPINTQSKIGRTVDNLKRLPKEWREQAKDDLDDVTTTITQGLQAISDLATGQSTDTLPSTLEGNLAAHRNQINTLNDFNAISIQAKRAKFNLIKDSLEEIKKILWQEQQDLRARLLIDSEIASLSALLDRHDATIVGLADCQKDLCKPKTTAQPSPSGGSKPHTGGPYLTPGQQTQHVITVPRPTEQPLPVVNVPGAPVLPDPVKPTRPSSTGLGTTAGLPSGTLSPDTVRALGERTRSSGTFDSTKLTCRQNAVGTCNNFPTKKEREKCLSLSQAYIKACEKAGISKATFSGALPSNNCGVIKNYCEVTTRLAQDLKPMVIAAREKFDDWTDTSDTEKRSMLEAKRDKLIKEQSGITGQKRYFYYNTKTNKIYTHKKLFISRPNVQFLGDAPSKLSQRDKDKIEKLQEEIDTIEKQITELRVNAKSKVAWSEGVKSNYRTYLNHRCMTRSPSYFAKKCHYACNRHFQPEEGFTPAPEAAGYSALSQFPCGALTKVNWQLMHKPGHIPKFVYDYAKSYKIYNKLR